MRRLALEEEIKRELDDPRISVKVVAQNGVPKVHLTGTLRNRAEVVAAVATAAGHLSADQVISALYADATAPTLAQARDEARKKTERKDDAVEPSTLADDINFELVDTRISVEVRRGMDRKYRVRLTGTVQSAGERSTAETEALTAAGRYVKPELVTILNSLTVSPAVATREQTRAGQMPPTAAQVRQRVEAILNDPRVKVEALESPGGPILRLTGAVINADERAGLEQLAKSTSDRLAGEGQTTVQNDLRIDPYAPDRELERAAQEPITVHYRLQFLSSSVTPVTVPVVGGTTQNINVSAGAPAAGSGAPATGAGSGNSGGSGGAGTKLASAADAAPSGSIPGAGTTSPGSSGASNPSSGGNTGGGNGTNSAGNSSGGGGANNTAGTGNQAAGQANNSGSAINAAGGPAGQSSDSIDQLVAALNEAFKATAHVGRARGELIIQGQRGTVRQIVRLLALHDAPFPQVQLDMWVVQSSGGREQVARRMEAVNALAQQTREDISWVRERFYTLVANKFANQIRMDATDQVNRQEILNRFKSLGFDTNPARKLNLNEALILLTFRKDAGSVIETLRKDVQAQMNTRHPEWKEKKLKLFRRLEEDYVPTARADRGTHAFALASEAAWFQSLKDLTNAITLFKAKNSNNLQLLGISDEEAAAILRDGTAPWLLTRTSVATDALLRGTVEAFAADVQEMFLNNFEDRVRRELGLKERSGGISVTHRTRVVVTSSIESRLRPDMVSFTEDTAVRPFGMDMLTSAFDPKAGLASFFPAMPQAQLALMAAALASPVQPSYVQVAPGIQLNVRPSVLHGSAGARLQIDASFGVQTQPYNDVSLAASAVRQRPADRINSHHIQTDAAISAFDLFSISSFAVTTSSPRSPYYVPVLGRLPIVGQAFQIPRGHRVTDHESVILVNTTILPRSIDLAEFYGNQ